MKKSQIVSFLLTFFFGPLGLFYSTISGAIAMILASIAAVSFTAGLGLFVVWPACILLGVFAVHRHNKGSRLDDKRHEELVQATRESGSVQK